MECVQSVLCSQIILNIKRQSNDIDACIITLLIVYIRITQRTLINYGHDY